VAVFYRGANRSNLRGVQSGVQKGVQKIALRNKKCNKNSILGVYSRIPLPAPTFI